MTTRKITFFALGCLWWTMQTVTSAERVALVIGNSAYEQGTPLANPKNDAKAVAEALRGLGFEVVYGEDASLEEMEEKLMSFRNKAEGAKAAWFFYAGHGVEVNGVNYLVPVDAAVKEEFQVKHKTLALDQVLGAMNTAGAPLKVVVLDCCRDNPFGRSWARGAVGGLAQVGDTPQGTIIAYAAAPGKTAADGRGANSPYTTAMLEALAKPGLDIDQVFKETGRLVLASTGRKQQPWINSSFYDRFVLRPSGGGATPLPVPVPEPMPAASGIAATKSAPFKNSLGMKFVPVEITGGPTDGKRVLFSVWETRRMDYEAYAKANSGVDGEWKTVKGNEALHPVVNVSWEDAKAFCAWLTREELASGKIGPGDAYRLPSDHEWSCAVGIGAQEDASESPEEKKNKIETYPWGNAWPPTAEAGNYSGQEASDDGILVYKIENYTDSHEMTAPVGSYRENNNGLSDLSGNVWEWCEDWLSDENKFRVLRGGSWGDVGEDALSSSFRRGGDTRTRINNIGFRCVVVSGG